MFTKQFDTCTGQAASISAQATARATAATVTYSAVSGVVGYNIYRTVGGVRSFLTRARTTTFEDSGLALNTTYGYEVRPFMSTNCESGSALTTVTTRANANGVSRVPTLKVLLPFYTGGPEPYTTSEINNIKAGIELSRQWYYRNSAGRLNLTLDFLLIAAEGPSTEGGTMANIETDLRTRGIIDNQYEGVFPIARNLVGCLGGFVLLGQTVGAFASNCGVPYPTNDPNVDLDKIWGFTHEFQHAFDAAAEISGTADLISGHPDGLYNDMPYFGQTIDAGEHYDWEAQTLRLFTGFDTLAGPFSDYLEVDDPDGDRLASNDARLPMDEQRFGSSSTLADTDGDGLNDRGEYAAGRFASSNPVVADTDGDGQRDGIDPTPRQAIAASMTALTPAIDGVRDAGYTLFRNGVEFSNVAGFTAATYIAYDANNLYLLAEMSQSASLLIIDAAGPTASGRGRHVCLRADAGNAAAQSYGPARHAGDAGRAPAGSVWRRGRSAPRPSRSQDPADGSRPGLRLDRGNTNGFPTSVGTVLGMRIWFAHFAAPVISSPRPGRPRTSTFTSMT
jgi:hypothetical protein